MGWKCWVDWWNKAIPWEWIQPPRCWLCGRAAGGIAAMDVGGRFHGALPHVRQTKGRQPLPVSWACATHVIDPTQRLPSCGCCDRPLRAGLSDGASCRPCLLARQRGGLAGGLSPRLLCLGEYREPRLNPWILAFKHGGRVDLAQPLGALLASRVLARWGGAGKAPETGTLIPVPLHPARKAERGYDQALELALVLGRHLGWPVESPLERVRSTAPQGSWRAPTRGKNVEQAFRASPARILALKKKPLWLVDDVTTSGETLGACAAALAGANVAGALVLARAGLAPGPAP